MKKVYTIIATLLIVLFATILIIPTVSSAQSTEYENMTKMWGLQFTTWNANTWALSWQSTSWQVSNISPSPINAPARLSIKPNAPRNESETYYQWDGIKGVWYSNYVADVGNTIDRKISLGTDDACMIPGYNPIYLSTSSINLGEAGSNMHLSWVSVLKFNGIDSIKGKTVTDAYISLFSNTIQNKPCSIIIYGENSDNPVTFSTSANIISRPLTTTSIIWNTEAWVGSTWYKSADISSIIQEIINRPSWVNGNSIVFILKNNGVTGVRSGMSFDASIVNAPKLHVVCK